MNKKILISSSRIKKRLKQLAQAIDRRYCGRELVVLGVLNGSVIFLADLIRLLKTPLSIDFLSASICSNNRSTGKAVIRACLKVDLRGKHVLLVDDILDTGDTIHSLLKFLNSHHPASIQLCVLLRKRVHRSVTIRPRFVGFDIPNHFVFGYGLDYSERFRNLPDIVYRE